VKYRQQIDDYSSVVTGNRDTMRCLRSTPEWQERQRRQAEMRIASGEDWWPPPATTEAPSRPTSARQPAPAPRRGRPPNSFQVNAVKLKSLREGFEEGYSQEDFAGKCDVSLASIQRGEAGGRLSRAVLEKVVSGIKALGGSVTVEDLILRRPD
jgi:hypothetical protein